MMHCSQAGELISRLVDGELTAGSEGDLEEHLKACSSCRELLEEERLFSERLRRAVAVPAESLLLLTEGIETARGATRPSPRARRRATWSATAAAAVLVAAGWALWRGPPDSEPTLSVPSGDSVSGDGDSRGGLFPDTQGMHEAILLLRRAPEGEIVPLSESGSLGLETLRARTVLMDVPSQALLESPDPLRLELENVKTRLVSFEPSDWY